MGDIMDLLIFHESRQKGSNECEKLECPGGLCLALRSGGGACACPSHFSLAEDGVTCIEPEKFLLFGQKNKVSRFVIEDGEVPDVGKCL
jgi:low density lipoprotein receptor-related protein 5/6